MGAGAVSAIVFAGSIGAAPPALPIVRVMGGSVRGVIDGDVTSYDLARDRERLLKTLGDRRERELGGFGAGDPARATATLWTDLTITEPDRFLAHAMTRIGEPVYLYFFAYRSPVQRDDSVGVSHGDEVGFVFNNPALRWAGKAQAAPAVPPEDLATTNLVHAYWINFAKPGVTSAPTWPSIGNQGEPVMVFADTGPASL